ncbi:TMEM175 family protein [Arachidicoccus terrestris]|uniref:TMEM175 family protein n=1 Tax=Arachidicoccus terrestris TaxID=2875539 RepID=UPI001CC40046|nr:TMEM175 family protein [Arachidicoccus terrestris]UAY57173.1 TMEM175 family protein [Arachidicoccus terrestris]
MEKNRLEAFSDGVLAIIITIMVLELKIPESGDGHFSALLPLVPKFLSYILSFIYVGIYWNNHHHMLQCCKVVNGKVLWANLHLLFWLSLFPFTTAWVGENHTSAAPLALYGFVLFMAAIAWVILLNCLIHANDRSGLLAKAVENKTLKEQASPFIYIAGIASAFFIPWLSIAFYALSAIIWLVPDKRIEKALKEAKPE